MQQLIQNGSPILHQLQKSLLQDYVTECVLPFLLSESRGAGPWEDSLPSKQLDPLS